MRLVALLVLALLALPPERYEIARDSRFIIEGTATTGDWTCEADGVTGAGVLTEGREVTAQVSVPVREFDCGFGPMTRDLRRALRAREHAAIRFELDSAWALAAEPRPGAWVPVRTIGTVHLAGTARTLTLTAEGRRLENGRVELRGHHPLRMSDFGVEPPSHALGLVRAHDDLVARFTIIATR